MAILGCNNASRIVFWRGVITGGTNERHLSWRLRRVLIELARVVETTLANLLKRRMRSVVTNRSEARTSRAGGDRHATFQVTNASRAKSSPIATHEGVSSVESSVLAEAFWGTMVFGHDLLM